MARRAVWLTQLSRRVILLCTAGVRAGFSERSFSWFLVGFSSIAQDPQDRLRWGCEGPEIIYLSSRMQIFRSFRWQGPENELIQGPVHECQLRAGWKWLVEQPCILRVISVGGQRGGRCEQTYLWRSGSSSEDFSRSVYQIWMKLRHDTDKYMI